MDKLNILIKDFLEKYTFNNIEVLLNNGSELSLEDDHLVKKITNDCRGGYCFENNQYFYSFLNESGFEVSRGLGRVVYGNDSANVGRTHQFTIVQLEDGAYIADVGFGPYTPGVAVPLSGELVRAFNGNEYKVIKLNDVDFQLHVLRDGEFFSLYEFNLAFYNQADFKISNYFTSTHPNSKFRTSLIISKLTSKGVFFVNNVCLSVLENGTRTDFVMNSFEDFEREVKENFDVGYSKEELLRVFKQAKAFA